MALPIKAWGSLTRSGGIASAYAKQARLVNLGGATKIVATFDPFQEIEPVIRLRRALQYLFTQRKRETNPKCIIKYEVTSAASEPTLSVKLKDGPEIIFKTQNLTTLEILELFNKHVTSRAPKKEVITIAQTKAQKKGEKKK